MENSPLVSVIMPAHNAAAFISESIDSVLQQTYRHWELLIIDDASFDATPDIIKDFEEKDERISSYRLPANQGAGFARNIGIKASSGDFISFLDADDLWLSHKLEAQLKFMEDTGAQVAFSTYQLIDEAGIKLGKQVVALENLSFNKLLRANYIGNLTGIYNASSLGKIYCPLIRKRQDWGLWLLAVKKAGNARGITEFLALYRVRKNSLSRNKAEMLRYNFRVYRKVLGFSSLKSYVHMLLFLSEQFLIKNKQIKDL